jgi:hypothetical protein
VNNETTTFIQKVSANLPEEDIHFLDTINKNHSEAIRILIKNARNKKNRPDWIRQTFLNISIGFIALSLFFIWASIVSWIFIILAILIFTYEIFDLIYTYRTRTNGKEKQQ